MRRAPARSLTCEVECANGKTYRAQFGSASEKDRVAPAPRSCVRSMRFRGERTSFARPGNRQRFHNRKKPIVPSAHLGVKKPTVGAGPRAGRAVTEGHAAVETATEMLFLGKCTSIRTPKR